MQKHGFTLIEVLVALAVVSIALSAVLVTNTTAVRHLQYLKQHILANMVATDAAAAVVAGEVTIDTPHTRHLTTIDDESFAWSATNHEADDLQIQVFHQKKTVLTREFLGSPPRA